MFSKLKAYLRKAEARRSVARLIEAMGDGLRTVTQIGYRRLVPVLWIPLHASGNRSNRRGLRDDPRLRWRFMMTSAQW